MQTWTRRFARKLEAPRWARAFVLEVLEDRLSEEAISDVLVMTSEITTNGVLHPEEGEWLDLSIDDRSGCLIVRVRDSGSGFRPAQLREPREDGGLGLAIVEAFSSRWGADPSPNGTEVWFELAPR